MTSITARQLIGLPVKVPLQTVGRVTRLVFDLDRGQVAGFIVDCQTAEPQLLARTDVTLVDKESVTTAQTENITDLEADTMAARANQAARHVINADAQTEGGQTFGVVIDLTLSLPLLTIEQFLVQEESGERLIPRSQVVMVGDNQVIFKDDPVTKRLKWEAKAPVGAVPA